jgi:transposase InsO family protein
MLRNQYPLATLCRALGVSRSRAYRLRRAAVPPAVAADPLTPVIHQILSEFPTYGYRRVTAELRRRGHVVNHKKVRRRLAALHLLQRPPRRGRAPITTQHAGPPPFPNLVRDLALVRPNQVWAADITYIRLGQGFVYLAVLLDLYPRLLRGWALGERLDAALPRQALTHALALARPEIHHSDQGHQYADRTYVAQLQAAGVQVSMSDVGAAWQNGYAERVIRTIKEECLDLHEFRDLAEVYAHLRVFLDEVYNHKRIHAALGYRTPAEALAAYARATGGREVPRVS